MRGEKNYPNNKTKSKMTGKNNFTFMYCTILQLLIALFGVIAGANFLGTGTGFGEFNYAREDRDYC